MNKTAVMMVMASICIPSGLYMLVESIDKRDKIWAFIVLVFGWVALMLTIVLANKQDRESNADRNLLTGILREIHEELIGIREDLNDRNNKTN